MPNLQLFRTGWIWATAQTVENGDLYIKVSTAPAVVILPYWKKGDEVFVLLLKQYRPEIGRNVEKTCGGYLKKDESSIQAAVRNLEGKMGLVVAKNELCEDGRMQGYSVVDIPISIFRVKLFQPPSDIVNGVSFSLREAVKKARAGEFLDDSTVLPILQLALDEL